MRGDEYQVYTLLTPYLVQCSQDTPDQENGLDGMVMTLMAYLTPPLTYKLPSMQADNGAMT